MANLHYSVERGRKPRVQITYAVDQDGTSVEHELPFVVGVLADFAGNGKPASKPLRDRKFVHIDRETFNEVMGRIGPSLELQVADALRGGDEQVLVRMAFQSIADFEPASVVARFEPLQRLWNVRVRLRELIDRLDLSPELHTRLERQLASSGAGGALEAKPERVQPPAQAPALDAVLEATRTAEERAGSRLERFLAATTPADGLIVWLALESGARLPARGAIAERLSCDIAFIDSRLAAQVDAILHHPRFQALEASWRGLDYLARQIEEGDNVKLRILDVTWRELARDLERAMEFDQSQLFRKVYSAEFGTPGGEPFSLLVGDYYVHHRPSAAHPVDDLGTLLKVSQVAAASFSPFIAAAHPSFFGLDVFAELERPLDLGRTFAQDDYVKWHALRQTEDSRFVGLTLPRILLRAPWRDVPSRTDGFRYSENVSAPGGESYLWGNAAFAFAAVVLRAFSEYGWPAAIRGVERDYDSGGRVPGLLVEHFAADAAPHVAKCACEVVITDSREKDLGDLGFIPLCACHRTQHAAFYGSQSVQRPKKYDTPAATVNAKLSAMLQYMLCVSRFAHYLKVMGRDRIGSFATASECEDFLNNWIVEYSTSNEDVSSELQAQYPLRQAQVSVRESAGRPGVFSCVAHLRPHFQLDQMTSSIKLVTELFEGHAI